MPGQYSTCFYMCSGDRIQVLVLMRRAFYWSSLLPCCILQMVSKWFMSKLYKCFVHICGIILFQKITATIPVHVQYRCNCFSNSFDPWLVQLQGLESHGIWRLTHPIHCIHCGRKGANRMTYNRRKLLSHTTFAHKQVCWLGWPVVCQPLLYNTKLSS